MVAYPVHLAVSGFAIEVDTRMSHAREVEHAVAL